LVSSAAGAAEDGVVREGREVRPGTRKNCMASSAAGPAGDGLVWEGREVRPGTRRKWFFRFSSAAGAAEDMWWEGAARSGWGRGGGGFLLLQLLGQRKIASGRGSRGQAVDEQELDFRFLQVRRQRKTGWCGRAKRSGWGRGGGGFLLLQLQGQHQIGGGRGPRGQAGDEEKSGGGSGRLSGEGVLKEYRFGGEDQDQVY